MMWIVDVGLLALFLMMIIIGAKKGFVRSVLDLVIWIASFIFSVSFSENLADYFYDNILAKPIGNKIALFLAENQIGNDVSVSAKAFLSEMPSFFQNVANSVGMDLSSLSNSISGASSAQEILEHIVAPIMRAGLHLIFIIVLFAVSMTVLFLLEHFILKAFKLPVIRTANGLLGGVLGAFKGCILVVTLSLLLFAVCQVKSMPQLQAYIDASKIVDTVTHQEIFINL